MPLWSDLAVAQSASIRARSARTSGRRHEARVTAPQVHRTVPAQRGEARMHLGHEAAGMRPQARLAGPEPAVRVALGQGLGHGERVPDHDRLALDPQSGHQRRGGELRKRAGKIGGVHGRQHGLHRQAETREHQPAAKRPARIRPIANRQHIAHPGTLRITSACYREPIARRLRITSGPREQQGAGMVKELHTVAMAPIGNRSRSCRIREWKQPRPSFCRGRTVVRLAPEL